MAEQLVMGVIGVLPEGSPAPEHVHDFGYCAEAGLIFEGKGLEQKLLALYLPLPLVAITGVTSGGVVTQKPERYVRDKDQSNSIEPIYPAVLKHETGRTLLRWWTELAGRTVEVLFSNPDPKDQIELDIDSELYEPAIVTYATGTTTFYRRRTVRATGLRQSAQQRWKREWMALCDRHGWGARQKAFVLALRSYVECNEEKPFTMADLPEPHYLRPGTALAIPEGCDLLETVETLRAREAARSSHWLDQVGDFWGAFTREEAEELVAFAESQRQALPRVRQQLAEELETVARVAHEFFADRGRPWDDMHIRDLVEDYIRRTSGLDVRFRLIRGELSTGKVKLTPYFDPYDALPDITVQCKPEAILRLQDIPVVYVGD